MASYPENDFQREESGRADFLKLATLGNYEALSLPANTAKLLAGLHELQDAGLLTEEEFQNEKQPVVAASERALYGTP